MDPCIVDDSVQIPTRCSFVIEFIIPTFIEIPTRCSFVIEFIIPTFIEIPTRCSFVIEFIIPNFGIINSIPKVHLVGISTEYF
jgi:hypothetical protein